MNFLKSKILVLNRICIFIVLIGIVFFDLVVFCKVYRFYNACYIMEMNGKSYCVKNRYYNAPLLKGLIVIKGDTYYFDDNSVMVKDAEIDIDGKQYKFDIDGKLINIR